MRDFPPRLVTFPVAASIRSKFIGLAAVPPPIRTIASLSAALYVPSTTWLVWLAVVFVPNAVDA